MMQLPTISILASGAVASHLSAIWQGAILTLSVAACLRIFPGLTAKARSAIWLNVFTALLLLHFSPLWAGSAAAPDFGRHAALHLDPRWSVAIAAVWLIVSLWRGANLVRGAVHSHRMARRATAVDVDSTLQPLLRVRGERQGGRVAALCTSAEVERPCVLGFFRPRILFPASLYAQLTPAELRQVILHEMEHLRRADDWTNLLQKAALVLFPLNPVLMLVERRLCAEREIACDDSVLRLTRARKSYALCLTRLAEYSLVRRGVSLVVGAWDRQSELVHRVQRLLRSPGQSMSSRRAAVLTAGLTLSVAAGAVALAHSPQLVSFAPASQVGAVVGSSLPPATFHAAEFHQALFHEAAAAPALVKATVERRPIQKPRLPRHQQVFDAMQRSSRQPVAPPPAPSYVVLTEWDEQGPPPQLILTVFHQKSYAAVAFANGWLIVQI
jgi:beta-lactamase regulating signal transducer with metallopeptidase domain